VRTAIAFLCIALLGGLAGCGRSGESIDTAAAEYVKALADGTFDGYLKHEQAYRTTIAAEKQSIPSDMWTTRETALRDGAKVQIRQDMQQNAYSSYSDACYLIVREGAVVKTKEIRSASTDAGQVFYDVSYGDESRSPVIVLQNGKHRFFRSGVFDVAFAKSTSTEYVAQRDCVPVDGTVSTWPVPPLSSDDAVRIVNQAQAIPTQYVLRLNRIAGVGSDRSWTNWQEFVGAAQLLKSTLEKHGWSVSGFQNQSMYYYDIHGDIEPPDSARKWIVGSFAMNGYGGGNGYKVVLLERARSEVLSFNPQDDTAAATFRTQFSGCTAFCKLWKDMHALPFDLGNAVFADWSEWHNPSLASLDGIYTDTTVNFAWEPNRGWHL
jgi:hypothetical protein